VNYLLTLTAVIEMGTGLVLVASPSLLATLLFGSSLDTVAALTVGRVTGAALLALGMACWIARHDGRSRAKTGLVVAMLLYNLAAVSIFVPAGIGTGLGGLALWSAVVLHAVMAIWCIACLRGKRVKAGKEKWQYKPMRS
jgi:hypothetical protein